jgi:hypothetical protein
MSLDKLCVCEEELVYTLQFKICIYIFLYPSTTMYFIYLCSNYAQSIDVLSKMNKSSNTTLYTLLRHVLAINVVTFRQSIFATRAVK